MAHFESFVERVNVAQITSGDDYPIGDLPIELLQDFNGGGFLPLEPKTVERIGQVNRQLRRDAADQFHTPVEIRVDAEDEGAVGDGLD